ncbi:hypothetical protein LCGC14_2732990, partial [marine sediment metagenome]
MEEINLIKLIEMFILERDTGVRMWKKEVKKMTPNQGGMY